MHSDSKAREPVELGSGMTSHLRGDVARALVSGGFEESTDHLLLSHDMKGT